MTTDQHDGLRTLEAALTRDLERLNLPAANWVPAQQSKNGAPLLDVLVVGGGMCGLTAAMYLRRLGITNIRVVDAQPEGRTGPWRTFARMETLRSPKHLTGPASSLPNLTFRAWYEARNGSENWADLGYILRETWADYLDWFARITAADVENDIQLQSLSESEKSTSAITWQARLRNRTTGITETLNARFVVLATGREGLAVPRIPPVFAQHRGKGVDHSGDAPAASGFHGLDVAVIGLGASAFDYAAEALEAGARHVRILGRSAALSRINKAKQVGYAGFLHGFPLLPDKEKADLFSYVFARGIAPPRGTVHRVMRHPNVELVLSAPVTELTRDATGRFKLNTPRGTLGADRLVLGTGYTIDINAPDYLAGISGNIRRWRDELPKHPTAGELLDFPYLGQGFEFLSTTDEKTTALSRLLCFNHAAMMSLGNLANDIPAVSDGADRLARHIAAMLYLEDRSSHRHNLESYEEPELHGDEIPGLSSWWPEVNQDTK